MEDKTKKRYRLISIIAILGLGLGIAAGKFIGMPIEIMRLWKADNWFTNYICVL